MARRRVLPLAAVERLMKKAGAERISPSAVKALADLLETAAEDIAARAVRYATYAKRKTITRADIELAASE